MRGKQLSLLPKPSTEHGGGKNKCRRKTARPIDPKRPMHLTLRSSRAKGKWSMLHPKNVKRVRHLLDRLAEENKIKIHRFVNVGNHLHLAVQTKTRKSFQRFLRQLTGMLATLITGATKGKPAGKFWDTLAFTKIINWGRQWRSLHLYFLKNLKEARGIQPHSYDPWIALIPSLIALPP